VSGDPVAEAHLESDAASAVPEPTLDDIREARRLIQGHLPPTPFYESAAIGRTLGLRLWIKYENHQPTVAFKVRGTLNRILNLTEEEAARGVVTASAGNHGQGVSYAARLRGIRATVVAPEQANPDKVEAMRNLGADVILAGRDFDEADRRARELEAEKGFVYFHAANDPWIIAGHGTVGLEMLEQEPDLDVLVVPLGAGGLISGVALAAKSLKPGIDVLGVQAKDCAPYFRSRELGRMTDVDSAATFADGLASRHPTILPFRMIDRLVDDIVVATEEEMRRAILTLLEKTHHLAEGAGAAGTAGVVKLRERLAGKRVGTILSGGNLNRRDLVRALTDPNPW
jgi:threonine dehydratase